MLARDLEAFRALFFISIRLQFHSGVSHNAYRLEKVLVDSFIAERLQVVPVESGLPGTWASTEDDKFKWVLASKGFGCDEDLSTIC